MLSNTLRELFKVLDDNCIQYVILRGYASDEEIEAGKDIDIYIAKEDKKRVEKVLGNCGWQTSKINTNIYPHKQYYKICGKCYKLDIQFALCFADASLKYLDEENVIVNSQKRGNYNTPSNSHALDLLLAHVVYDKKKIEDHNRSRLEYYFNLPGYTPSQISFIEQARGFIKKGDWSPILVLAKNYVDSAGILQKRINLADRMIVYFKGKFRSICMRLKKKSIAFIGVDGTGKSSVIEKIHGMLNERSTIIYMGNKNFENAIAKKCAGDGSIKGHLAVYQNMWSRYLRKRYSYSGIVLFDRYVNERYINAPEKTKFIYKIIYKLFFPKPGYMIYLYCNADVSMERKNDIIDKEQFIHMKERFDSEFLNREGILSIDTGSVSFEEVIEIIQRFISVNCMEWIM